MRQPRVLFAGTPEFALASLSALVDHVVRPVAVLTQPDRRAGRGKTLRASPVKRYALDHAIDVLQPATLKDDTVAAELERLEPDIMIVAAYGLILPQRVLDIPSRGCVNVHASLLPRWRGAAPVQAAILAGDEETGISLMAMTAGLDCGPVFAAEAITIGAEETAGELHDRLAALGGRMLAEHFDAILRGELEPVAQNDAAATYAGKIRTADAGLDWALPAATLERRVRAYNPVPGAWFMHDGERIKCFRARCLADTVPGVSPGAVLHADADGVVVACRDGTLALDELQRPGRRRVTAAEFVAQLELGNARFG